MKNTANLHSIEKNSKIMSGVAWKDICPLTQKQSELQKSDRAITSMDYQEPLRHLIVGDIDNKDEPRTFVEIRRSKDSNDKPIRCVQEFKLIPHMNNQTKQKFDVEVYGQKILDAVPVLPDRSEMVNRYIIYDPLFKVPKKLVIGLNTFSLLQDL